MYPEPRRGQAPFIPVPQGYSSPVPQGYNPPAPPGYNPPTQTPYPLPYSYMGYYPIKPRMPFPLAHDHADIIYR